MNRKETGVRTQESGVGSRESEVGSIIRLLNRHALSMRAVPSRKDPHADAWRFGEQELEAVRRNVLP
jgi:hypothetical protein